MTKKFAAAVSHDAREVEELRADRALAVEYLKLAMQSLDDPDDRAAGLSALRNIAEAHGGLAAIAAEAGISREALYRSLSPTGNPTLKTLLAVLKAVGMRLSVEHGGRASAALHVRAARGSAKRGLASPGKLDPPTAAQRRARYKVKGRPLPG
jgi:probable addiction module antidote protein